MRSPDMLFTGEAALGFVIALVTGWLLLRVLPRFAFRQTAYEDAPESHRAKTGTPTMGGLAILAAIAVAWAVDRSPSADALAFLAFGCGAIGFLDDYLGIRRGTNAGLRARTKFLATALVAAIFMRLIPDSDTIVRVGSAHLDVAYWLWLILGILAVVGTSHAVNLTDGLDGLAAGAMIPPLYVFWALSLGAVASETWPAILPFAIGGCVGFLVYNRHPARIFMGDTGSLALGALLAGAAILDGQMLLLVIVGGLFVAEALSVMIQVIYFRLSGGKRIFLMSPLHHHFELAGVPERSVTLYFWLASLLCSVVGWAIGNF